MGGGADEGGNGEGRGHERAAQQTAQRPFVPSAVSEFGPQQRGNEGEGFKQLVRTMVNLASLLGVLASATALVVLVALGRIAFGRHLASLHHLASLGIHRTRRRGGGGGGSGGSSGRSTGSLPLAHCCCVRSIFLFPPWWFPSFPVPLVCLPSLSLSLFSLAILSSPDCSGLPLDLSALPREGLRKRLDCRSSNGNSSQLSGSPQTLPDGATSMPRSYAVQPRASSKA
ncbi:hypothetical protein J3F84DRAFT_225888 [Trichoderma pleuroticola]